MKKLYPRICSRCGKEIESKRRRQTYCSITCSAKALKRGKRGGATLAPIDEWSLRPMLRKREAADIERRERLAARDADYAGSPCAAPVTVEERGNRVIETRGRCCLGWRSCGHISHNGRNLKRETLNLNPETMTDYRKEFIKELEQMAQRRNIVEVFGDAVGMMAAALEKATAHDPDEVEKRYMSYVSRYTKDELAHAPKMLEIVTGALDLRRESFLGPVLEEVGAANTRNGQFLTPASVANMMARVNMGEYVHTPGKVVTVNDSACGAGVTLIAQGEMLMHEKHVPQGDIYIVGGDIDLRACDMTYIELTLLGYAARVDHMDALSMEVLSPSRYTLGYFLYSMPMRGVR